MRADRAIDRPVVAPETVTPSDGDHPAHGRFAFLYCPAPVRRAERQRQRGDRHAPQPPRRDVRLRRQRRPRRLRHPRRPTRCRLAAVRRRRRHRHPLPPLVAGRLTEGGDPGGARRRRARQPLRPLCARRRRQRLRGVRHRPSRPRPHAAALGPHRRRRPRRLEPHGRGRDRLQPAAARRAPGRQAGAVRPQPRLVHGAGLHRAPRRAARRAGAQRHVVRPAAAAGADRHAQRRGAQRAAGRFGGVGRHLQGLQQAIRWTHRLRVAEPRRRRGEEVREGSAVRLCLHQRAHARHLRGLRDACATRRSKRASPRRCRCW